MKSIFLSLAFLWIFIPSKDIDYLRTTQEEFCLGVNLLLDERDEQYKTCFGEKINDKKYMCSRVLPGSMWGNAINSDFPALTYVIFETKNIDNATNVYKNYVKQLKICLPHNGYYYTEQFKSRKEEVASCEFTAKGESRAVIKVKVSAYPKTRNNFSVRIDFNS